MSKLILLLVLVSACATPTPWNISHRPMSDDTVMDPNLITTRDGYDLEFPAGKIDEYCRAEISRFKVKLAPKHFPVKLLLDTVNSPESYEGVVYGAAEEWNDSVGAQVFTVESFSTLPRYEECDAATVRVGDIDFPPPDANGRFLLGLTSYDTCKADALRLHDTVQIDTRIAGASADISRDVIYETALHELGHVLGLIHEDDEWNSIMQAMSHPERPLFISSRSRCLVQLAMYRAEHQ